MKEDRFPEGLFNGIIEGYRIRLGDIFIGFGDNLYCGLSGSCSEDGHYMDKYTDIYVKDLKENSREQLESFRQKIEDKIDEGGFKETNWLEDVIEDVPECDFSTIKNSAGLILSDIDYGMHGYEENFTEEELNELEEHIIKIREANRKVKTYDGGKMIGSLLAISSPFILAASVPEYRDLNFIAGVFSSTNLFRFGYRYFEEIIEDKGWGEEFEKFLYKSSGFL